MGSLERLGEGIHSAWEVPGRAPGLGCVAAICAEGLARLTWPAATSGLIIAPDCEASEKGERGVERLAVRPHAGGLSVAFVRPPAPFGDWNAWPTAGRASE
jgi:hypothetical protein